MGNQTTTQYIDSQVSSITDILNAQTNSCVAQTSQVNSIKVIDSKDVTIRQGVVKQVADVVARCTQALQADSKIQNTIESAISQIASQTKDAINFNPGSQTANVITKNAVLLSQSIVNQLTNACIASSDQLNEIYVSGSSGVIIGQDIVDQAANVVAECVQKSAAITDIKNAVKLEFKQETTQTQTMIGLIILLIVVLAIIFIMSRVVTNKYVLGGLALVFIGGPIGAIIYRIIVPVKPTITPNESAIKDRLDFIDRTAQGAADACTASERAGYDPSNGYYWESKAGDSRFAKGAGPYIPPPGKVEDGTIPPKIRTGGAQGAPAGLAVDRVRQYAEIFGVLYYDDETDKSICTRQDLARPSLTAVATKLKSNGPQLLANYAIAPDMETIPEYM